MWNLIMTINYKVSDHHMESLNNNNIAPLHEKLGSCCQVEFGFVIFGNWWVNFFSFGKSNITKMKNSSNNSENCFLSTKRGRKSWEVRHHSSYSFKIEQLKCMLMKWNTWSFWFIPTISMALLVARYSRASLESASS